MGRDVCGWDRHPSLRAYARAIYDSPLYRVRLENLSLTDSPKGSVRKAGYALTTVAQWHRHAPPKRDIHWKDGRSAKENARAWMDASPNLQRDVARTLAACPDIGVLRKWTAEPEARVPIDRFRGEQPNIDLLIVAEDDRGPLVVAVEAKADEPFGNELAEEYERALATFKSKPTSKKLARIQNLLDRLGVDIQQADVQCLRYQLFTATAAALAEAERQSSDRATLVVHEFMTSLTRQDRRERNSADLDRFLATALNHRGGLAPGNVVGPFPINDAPSLYVGKARTVV